MMKHTDNTKAFHSHWRGIRKEAMKEGVDRQFVSGAQTTTALITMKKGAVVPKHTHENEQVALILSGCLRFTLWEDEGIRTQDVREGEFLLIPPHLPHEAEALEDTIDLDFFSPNRADWDSGDDQYLRDKDG